ncbi:MAG: TonB-dependent receptor [Bacteroidia bacterium]
MRSYVIFFLLLFFAGRNVHAQFVLSGTVQHSANSQPLTDATVVLSSPGKTAQSTLTDVQGKFSLSVAETGRYVLNITYVGYKTLSDTIELTQSMQKNYRLEWAALLSDAVIVSGIRAKDKSATTFTNLNREQLNERNFGQDMPVLLVLTPSTVVNSDAGAGVGYTGITIRGVDQTRINVTINGIPLNDAESQGLFWVNTPDFASSVEQVQIQRGVGTSTNGAAAFGSSINMQTTALHPKAYAEYATAAGSFNTFKNTVRFGTGWLNGGWTIDGRLSKITSDGFIDRASSDLKSYYLSAGRYTEKSILRLVSFSGAEKTYQAWNGIAEDVLDTNRTYNEFTYKNQTDNYQQDHYQLLYSYQLSKKTTLNTALHYTYGRGYYEEYKQGESFADYHLQDVIIGTDTITTTDLVRRRWLDNDFYGATFSVTHEPDNKSTFIAGGGASYYEGRHFGEVIWSQFASNSFIGDKYYRNNAYKTDANIYAKYNRELGKKWNAFADLQYRYVDYSFLGYDQNLNNVQQNARFNFFNPKAGIVYSISDSSNVYLTLAVSNKEPNRNDFVNSTPSSRPESEQLQNIELGWRKNWQRASLQVNYYLMYYRNQLILSGKINDVGAYTRLNVPESYRTGIELSASVNVTKKIQWSGNLTLSENKILSFTEYVDDYDWGGQWSTKYRNTSLAFSPAMIAASQWRFLPLKNATIDVISKYVSRQYMDNTENKDRSLDAFLVNDLRFSYTLKTKKSGWFRQLNAGVLINNVLGEKYEPNGYTYSGISGGVRSDYNYYYPQAGRNFLMQLTFAF